MSVAKFRPADIVDFVIVGAGAAGGVVAKELSAAGFQVVVLEQGPYLREKDFTHDEIHYSYLSGLMNDEKRQPVMYRADEREPARRQKVIGYGRQVGAGRYTLPRTIGDSTRVISRSVASSARYLERRSRIGPSPMRT